MSGSILSDTTASDLARDIAEALEDCEAAWIGDGVCNQQCDTEEFQFDGGD